MLGSHIGQIKGKIEVANGPIRLFRKSMFTITAMQTEEIRNNQRADYTMIMRSLTTAFLLALLLSVLAGSAAAQDAPPSTSEPYAGDLLCQPGVYLEQRQDCLPYGPSSTLTGLAQLGVSYPLPPLPSLHPPADLAYIPYQYIKLVYHGPVPVYGSLEDAIGDNVRRYVPNGFRYFSYNDRQERPEGVFYLAQTGEWLEGSYVSRVSPQNSQGFLFTSTPETAFGWLLDIVETQSQPGVGGQTTGRQLNRLEVVPIFDSLWIEDNEWFLVGINEWVEKKFIAPVMPNPTPPEGVTNGRWIELNLYHQTLMVYEQGEMIFATIVSSGINPFFTRPGLFQIFEKLDSTTMSTGNINDYYFLEDVPYTMYFDEARALHGAYWHSLFGYTRSHGCVNLSIADSRWLFDWAQLGEFVYVWDPTGRTPTDPAFYEQNGGGP